VTAPVPARRSNRPAIAAILAVVILTGGINFGWTLYYEGQQDHQWCALFGALDHGPAPTTPAGLKIERALLARGQSLGC
jgi:hypothetical protein